MSAAYVPLGTSVVPPYFRESVAYDAALIDFLSGQIGFAANKESLWPAEPPKESGEDRTKVLVVPTQGFGHSIEPEGLVVVNGKFRSLIDFWAHPDVMRSGFVEGYQMAASLIATDGMPLPRAIAEARQLRKAAGGGRGPQGEAGGEETAEERDAAEAGLAAGMLLDEVMKEQRSWKATAAFVKPPLWFERDPLFALFLLVAAVVFGLGYLLQLRLTSAAMAPALPPVDTSFAGAAAALMGAAAGR